MDSTQTTDITFVLCEGKHDAAILSRLLRENGYSNFTDKKLVEFPPRLNGYFDSILKKFEYTNEGSIRQRPQLPNFICKSKTKDKWFVFYEMGGDTKIDFTKELISNFKNIESDFKPEEQFETQKPVSIAFFFDADKDVNIRRKSFCTDYSAILPKFTTYAKDLREYSIKNNNPIDGFIDIGLFIYGNEVGSGTLEDIIIPLMRDGKEKIFNDANDFLDKYMTKEALERGSKKGKALIGVVGQPKNQGKANQVIITDTKLINKSKFDSSDIFKEILNFLQSF